MSTTDLLTLVSAYIPLEKSRQTYKGPCPFHEDRSTSLMVSPAKAIFKCFGCGAEGDASAFLTRIHQLDILPLRS